jgi:glycosyltransferase involved in cell wall biosynthesis
MRRLLIVSPHFCPVNTPDMQRVRMSLPRFVERGWEVTVLTVDDPTPTAPLDEDLARTVPTAVEVVRAYCFPRGLTRLVGIGNVALRALPFIFAIGCRLLAARRYDVVCFSTTMFGVLPMGRIWRALYGVPYVVDLQDPWVTDFYDRPGAPPPPGGWKYRIVSAAARILEDWTLRRASHVISVSPAYLTDLQARYRWFNMSAATVLPFGAPLRDFRLLRAGSTSPDPARIVYVGRLGDIMLPALRVFFTGIALARERGHAVRAEFLGTAYAPPPHAMPTTPALAAETGVTQIVHEQTSRIGYLDSLRAMRGAGVNLVLGSTDAGYMPSKFPACLASGRPLLIVAAEGSALVERARALSLPGLVAFAPGGEPIAAAAVAAFLGDLRRNPDSRQGRARPVSSDDDCADAQLAIFARIAGTP